MNNKLIRMASAVALSLLWTTTTMAQDSRADGPPKWTVGAIGIVGKSPFEAENTDADGNAKYGYKVFPHIAYRGERFFIEGLSVGYHLLKPSEQDSLQFSVDVIASARPIAGFSRNKITADAGLRLGAAGTFGTLSVSGLQDVTDTHNGTELSATYSYSFEGEKWSITPSVGMVWQSENLANYMWGVTKKQQDTLLSDDKPLLPIYQVTDTAVNYTAGLMASYRFEGNWSVISFANTTWLDKSIRANPGINKKRDTIIGLGIAYSF